MSWFVVAVPFNLS